MNDASIMNLPPDHWGPRSVVASDDLFLLSGVSVRRCLVESAVQDDSGVSHPDAGLHHVLVACDGATVLWERPLYHLQLSTPIINRDDSYVLLAMNGRLHRIDSRTGREEVEEAHYQNQSFVPTLGLVTADFEQISLELMEHFAIHPANLYELDPRQFERLLEAVFRNQGYRTALTPLHGDKGIDLRLWHKDSIGELLTLVQAKRHSPSRPIGIEAVQALFGAVEYERASRGLFVTTSRYLPGVHEWSDTIGRRIILASSEDVAGWCQQAVAKIYRSW